MLTTGARIGLYEITSLVGTGGMGEVYRARDTKLGRDVAIKVLPEVFAHDPDRLARFEREAHTLALLNHPNIATIYGVEESGGIHAIVMELVEGETLAERVGRGALPRDEALGIAKQVAEALEAAHRDGIIHRDLKPANIKQTATGAAKVLDFGLAKAIDGSAAPALADAPTITAAATKLGTLLGTAAYMSPEQARGESLDSRSDIWAFGAVLFEMFSGHRAFPGITVSDTLAAVLRSEPAWSQLPPDTPPSIQRLLRRCLAKDRRNRFQHMGDIRLEIGEILESGAPQPVMTGRRSRSSVWLAAASMLVLIVAATGLAIYSRSPDPAEQRFEINTPPTTGFTSFAISPDGRTVVFVATSDGQRRLWLRGIGSLEAQPMPGTEGALNPFWSPTGRAIGFFADGKLKRIDSAGGSPEIVANAPVAAGGAWSGAGIIVFNPAPSEGLHRVLETGGESLPVTRLDSRQGAHVDPVFLPDSRRFLFYATGAPESRGVHVGSLDSDSVSRLFDADAPAAFLPPDRILFIQQGTLFARRFDMGTLEPRSEPVPVARNVAVVSSSPAGVIVYRPVPARGPSPPLHAFDRAGNIVRTYGALQALSAEISPDGTRVAMHRSVGGNIDVWLLDLRRDIPTRLTSDASVEGFAIWSPDAARLVFQTGGVGLRIMSAAGVGEAQTLWRTATRPAPVDWSPDGRFILVRTNNATNTDRDLYALAVTADGKMAGEPIPVANTSFSEREGRFSPDGRWIAYQSNETGRFEIYVRPFPGPGEKVRVTAAGGVQVRWPRLNSKELFYLALDGTLMAVPVTLAASGAGAGPDVGTPYELFPTNLLTAANRDQLRQEYDVSPDGQRIVTSEVAEWRTPLTLVLNWAAPWN